LRPQPVKQEMFNTAIVISEEKFCASADGRHFVWDGKLMASRVISFLWYKVYSDWEITVLHAISHKRIPLTGTTPQVVSYRLFYICFYAYVTYNMRDECVPQTCIHVTWWTSRAACLHERWGNQAYQRFFQTTFRRPRGNSSGSATITRRPSTNNLWCLPSIDVFSGFRINVSFLQTQCFAGFVGSDCQLFAFACEPV
jgi:hypothetical protein